MQSTLIMSVAVPVGVATLILALAHQLWNARIPVHLGRWSLAVAPLVGLWSAFVVVKTWPELPPVDANQWTLLLAAAAGIYGAVDAQMGLPGAVRWLVRVGLCAALPWLVLGPLVEHSWDGTQTTIWVGGSAVALVAAWTSLDALAGRLPGLVMPLFWTVFGTGVATALGLSGTALLAQAAGGLTAAFGVMILLGFLRRDLDLSRAVAPVGVVALGGFLLGGHHYSELPLGSLVLLAALPFIAWAAAVSPIVRRGMWVRAAAQLALAALVVGGAAYVVLSQPDAASSAAYEPSADGGDGDSYDEDYGYD